MTSASVSPPKTTEELQNRITILEKFVELKSNECAYYRSKVHLMQIHPLPTQLRTDSVLPPEQSRQRRSISFEQSSSSETRATRSNSIDERHRTHVSTKAKPILKATKISLPFDRTVRSKSSRFTSPVRRYRKPLRSSYAQNQNYFDEEPAEGPSAVTHEKTIQCSEKDFQSSNTVLMIRLPRRFVKSLVEQQRKPIIPKLKVQLSSELLHRLSQSIYQPIRNEQKHSSTDRFTIQSQFGSIIANFNPDERKDRSETRAVRARMEVKSRLPPVRHLAKSRTELPDQKHRSDRRKKRHIRRRKNSPSRQDSSTNVTQTRDITLCSEEEPSNRTSNVIQQRNHRKTISKE